MWDHPTTSLVDRGNSALAARNIAGWRRPEDEVLDICRTTVHIVLEQVGKLSFQSPVAGTMAFEWPSSDGVFCCNGAQTVPIMELVCNKEEAERG